MGYVVYKHTSPSNKIYIGITSQNVNNRWRNGYGYKGCPAFERAIKKYGWDNIKHEIIYTGLTQEEAKQKEIEMIEYYQSTNSNYGYNISRGGDLRLSKPVNQYSLDGKFINRYNAISDIVSIRDIKVCPSNIISCCNGASNTAYGFVWRYDGYDFDYFFDDSFIIRDGHIVKINNNDYFKEIYQYDLNGNLINKYKSVYKIIYIGKLKTDEINRARENILRCCNHKIKKSNGYVWRFANDDFYYDLQHPNAWRKIVQCDINGNFIKEWDGITMAEKECGLKLCEVLAGRNKTAGGYKWFYRDKYYSEVVS